MKYCVSFCRLKWIFFPHQLRWHLLLPWLCKCCGLESSRCVFAWRQSSAACVLLHCARRTNASNNHQFRPWTANPSMAGTGSFVHFSSCRNGLWQQIDFDLFVFVCCSAPHVLGFYHSWDFALNSNLPTFGTGNVVDYCEGILMCWSVYPHVLSSSKLSAPNTGLEQSDGRKAVVFLCTVNWLIV